MKKEIALAIALAMGSTLALATDKAGSAADKSSATGTTAQQPAAGASDGSKDKGARERGPGGPAGPDSSAEPSASDSSSGKPIDPAATVKDEDTKKKAQ